MRESGVELSRAFSEGARSEGVDGHRPRAGLHRHALLRRRQPRRPRGHVHRLAQPGPVQRAQALPVRGPPDRAGHRAGRDPGHGRVPAGRVGRGRATPDRSRRPGAARGALGARGLRLPRPVLRRRRCPAPAAGGGRHGQRHGRPGRPQGLRGPALRGVDPLPRARRELPEPSGRPDPAREPGRPQAGRPRRRAPTSAWPSTATPTGCSWWTRRPRRCRAR